MVEILYGILGIIAPLFQMRWYPGVKIERGLRYDEENNMKLDVFYPKKIDESSPLLPVLLYVHGGAWSGN